MNLAQLRTTDPWSWEVTATRGVVGRRGRSSARQWTGKKRAAKVRQHPDGSDLQSDDTGRRLLAMMLPDAADSNPQARRETTCHCATMPPLGRHWFVSHDGHFCEACNLPAGNWRHVPRVSAL